VEVAVGLQQRAADALLDRVQLRRLGNRLDELPEAVRRRVRLLLLELSSHLVDSAEDLAKCRLFLAVQLKRESELTSESRNQIMSKQRKSLFI
jgi:hypothetical protein